jgi:hypothetical protein
MLSARTARACIALVFYCLSAAGPAFAQQTNYIPATAALVSLNAGKVCAIGSSMSATVTVTINGTPTSVPVPAYYLTANGQQAGVWTQVTSATTVSALQVGSDITSLPVSPIPGTGNLDQPYINGAAIRFFVIPSGSSANCSSITIQITDTGGDYNFPPDSCAPNNNSPCPPYPYPQALFELSAYPSGPNNVVTIDTSNVDSFEAPLMIQVSSSSSAVLAQIGNPVYSPQVATTTMISGPGGAGGSTSPFVTWLQAQSGYGSANGPQLFQSLALPTSVAPPTYPWAYPFAKLQAAKDYLSALCYSNSSIPTSVPSGCSPDNSLLNWADPLASYFDTQLSTFFTNAYANPAAPLVVMGDASSAGSGAPISESPWTVTSNTAACPVYLNDPGNSLQFTQNGASNTVVVCNPVGAVAQLNPPPTVYCTPQTPQPCGTAPGSTPGTTELQISSAQYSLYNGYTNWTFGQPDSGFIAPLGFTITSGNASYCDGNPCITMTTANGIPNPNFNHWAFTNIQSGGGLNRWETSGQMVFGNDGPFAAWSPGYIGQGTNLSIVALSIERNIVWAFSHGIANCNNVTMNTVLEPSFCSSITATSIINANGANPSDMYWAKQTNWYPAGGPQDYYAQYLHTAQLQGNNIFVVPNNYIANPPQPACGTTINGIADSNQGIPMGTAYGFAYDENPDYLSSEPAQVPSKLDPIPPCWGSGLSLAVVIGKSVPTSTGNALSVSVTGNGTVTSAPSGISCGSTCNASFANRTQVTLTATAASGSVFTGWNGACSGTDQCIVVMNSAQNVSATFVTGASFNLAAAISGSGSVASAPSGISCGSSTCDASFASGAQVTLTATPATGDIFTGWSGACSGTGSCIVTMSAAESVTAMFATALTRTFVSASGVDTNPCTISAPCATFAHAYSLTGASGIIAALDPGKYGPLTITYPVTVNGNGWAAITGTAQGNGITVNAGSGNVILTGIEVDGAGAAYNGIVLNSGNSLTVSNCIVKDFISSNGTSGNGIMIAPAFGAVDFTIVNTIALNNGRAGIQYLPPSGSAAATGAIDHVIAANNAIGMAVDLSAVSGGSAAVTISNSVESSNTSDGIVTASAGSTVIVTLDRDEISSNGTGVAVGANTSVLLSRSVIAKNSTYGISNSGTAGTSTDNRIAGNGCSDIFGNALTSVAQQ